MHNTKMHCNDIPASVADAAGVVAMEKEVVTVRASDPRRVLKSTARANSTCLLTEASTALISMANVTVGSGSISSGLRHCGGSDSGSSC